MKITKLLTATLLATLFTIVSHGQINSDLYRNTPKGGVVSSGKLPDFTVYNDRGEQVNLKNLCNGKYTMLITGCLTCPEFRRINPTVEAIYADYAPKGVQFFFVYKTLRHPELDGYVEAQNISERILMVEQLKKILRGNIPWLIDDMDNSISSTLRSGSRSVYFISPKGEIISGWSSPIEESMRQALSSAVGPSKRVTTAAELNLPPMQRVSKRSNIESNNTIERADGLVIVKTTPHNPEDIYYVKMRAEADANLLEQGSGRLALGFFPDPLYEAHWNNLAEPMRFSITLPDGVEATPQTASAKRGSGDSDSDPRQFWVDIKGASPTDKIVLTYHYYGCTPDICEVFTHSYTIELTPEGHGASTFGFNKGQRGSSRGQHGNHRDGNNQGYSRGGGYQQNSRGYSTERSNTRRY